jgi:hypothetical protein
LATMQKNRHAGDRDVGDDQSKDHNLPPSPIEVAIC